MLSAILNALAFAMLIVVAAALINPKWFKNKKAGDVAKRGELAAGGLFLAGLFAVIGWMVGPTSAPSKPAATNEAAQQNHNEAVTEATVKPWIRPESIVEFPKGEVACINREDLQQALILGVTGRQTKTQAYFEDQDGNGPRCLMLPAGTKFKVIDAEVNDPSHPDIILLEVIGTEVKASDSGAFVPVIDRSMVKIVKAPPERP
ncbi:MAG: hypothetical protein J7498_14795 [Sphingobium sp.]|nr:hypothetical protein [Sphingobium sp.]